MKVKVARANDYCPGFIEGYSTHDGWVYGSFAVIRQTCKEMLPWSVTHMPTGFMAAESRTPKRAKEAARALSLLPIDWPTFTRAAVKTLPPDVLKQVHAIRLTACKT